MLPELSGAEDSLRIRSFFPKQTVTSKVLLNIKGNGILE